MLPPTGDQMPGGPLSPGVLGWTPDGRGIYYLEHESVSTHLFLAPADGGPFRRVTEVPGAKWGMTLNRDLSMVAFVGEDVGSPPEVWVRPPEGPARKVTAVNARLAELELVVHPVVAGADGPPAGELVLPVQVPTPCLVLDAWRNAGRLHWATVARDRYPWQLHPSDAARDRLRCGADGPG